MLKAIAVLTSVAGMLSAQPATYRGMVFDSLHGHPLSGALITLTQVGRSFTSDSLGGIIVRDLPSGHYRAVIQHDVLDTIGLNAVGTTLTLADNATFVAAIPSFTSLWRLACPTSPPARDSGLLFGTVSPAGGGKSAGGAVVQAFWLEVAYDKKAGLSQRRWMITGGADALGNFALCGVPTTTGLVVRAHLDSSTTGDYEVAPMGSHRIFRKDLALLNSGQAPPPTRTSTIRATAVDSTGAPISNAEVSVDALGLLARTGPDGKASLSGVSAGTQVVRAKAIGYAPQDMRLELGESPDRDVKFVLTRITVLDSMKVTGIRASDVGLLEFAEHMKRGFGTFITREQLAKIEGHPLDLALNQAQGATFARGYAGQAWIMSKNAPPLKCPKVPPPSKVTDQVDVRIQSCWRKNGYYLPDYSEGNLGMKPGCYSAVYLDRQLLNPLGDPVDLNSFPTTQIEAIEWYTGRTQAPIEYARAQSPCGIVILHRRR